MAQSLRQGTDILEFPSGQAGCMLPPAMSGAFRVVPVERDLIVSLGTNCEIAYNLRSFYGIEPTGLFDWVITPLSCLPTLIRNRFALVNDDFANNLVRVDLSNNDSVMHAPTGILLHHAFTRDENDHISPDWRSEIGVVAEKFQFLGDRMDRWLSEAALPALFINKVGLHEALSDDLVGQIGDLDIYASIIDAIGGSYPTSNPLFCIVNGHGPAVERAQHRHNVRVAMVGHHGDWHEGIYGHFAGCKTAWREALSSLNITSAGLTSRAA